MSAMRPYQRGTKGLTPGMTRISLAPSGCTPVSGVRLMTRVRAKTSVIATMPRSVRTVPASPKAFQNRLGRAMASMVALPRCVRTISAKPSMRLRFHFFIRSVCTSQTRNRT